MGNIWERFDNIASTSEVSEAKTKFTPLEAGTHLMMLEEIAPSESQGGLPMIKGKFRTTESNRVVFYNQMLQNINYPNMTAVNIAEAVTFISGIAKKEIEYTGLSAFADEISSIPTGYVYKIEVSYGKNDTEMKYPKLKFMCCEEDLNPEGFNSIPDGIDEELPFN